MAVSVVACPGLKLSFDKFLSVGERAGGNIADLRRSGKSGSGLSRPSFYDFARLPAIFCDLLRSMVAPDRCGLDLVRFCFLETPPAEARDPQPPARDQIHGETAFGG